MLNKHIIYIYFTEFSQQFWSWNYLHILNEETKAERSKVSGGTWLIQDSNPELPGWKTHSIFSPLCSLHNWNVVWYTQWYRQQLPGELSGRNETFLLAKMINKSFIEMGYVRLERKPKQTQSNHWNQNTEVVKLKCEWLLWINMFDWESELEESKGNKCRGQRKWNKGIGVLFGMEEDNFGGRSGRR